MPSPNHVHRRVPLEWCDLVQCLAEIPVDNNVYGSKTKRNYGVLDEWWMIYLEICIQFKVFQEPYYCHCIYEKLEFNGTSTHPSSTLY